LKQSGRKETVLDLAKFVDKGVQVKLTGGRQGYPIPFFLYILFFNYDLGDYLLNSPLNYLLFVCLFCLIKMIVAV